MADYGAPGSSTMSVKAINLPAIDADELGEMLVEAWRRTAPKRAVAAYDSANG